MRVEFFVHGRPQPQGSTKAFMPKGVRFPVVTSDNAKLKPWRQQVAGMAATIAQGITLDAVRVQCEFSFLRPKSTSMKVLHKTTKPDLDKLVRAVLDSLTGIVFRDDSQVIAVIATKAFAEREGAWICIESV